MASLSDVDGNDSDPSEVSSHDTGNYDERAPYNGDDIKTFSALTLTTTGAARSVLL